MEIRLHTHEYRYRELFGVVFKDAYKKIIEQMKIGKLPWREQFSRAASETHSIIKKLVEKGDIARYGKEPFPLVELWYRDPEYPYVRFWPTKGPYCTTNSYFIGEWIPFIYTLSVQTRNKNGSIRHVEIHCESVCTDEGETIREVMEKVDVDKDGVVATFVKALDLVFVLHTAYSSSFEFKTDLKVERPEKAEFAMEYYDYDAGEVRASASGLIEPPEWWKLSVDAIWKSLVTSSKLGKKPGPVSGAGKQVTLQEKYAKADLTVARMEQKLQDKPAADIAKMLREAQERFQKAQEDAKKKKVGG